VSHSRDAATWSGGATRRSGQRRRACAALWPAATPRIAACGQVASTGPPAAPTTRGTPRVAGAACQAACTGSGGFRRTATITPAGTGDDAGSADCLAAVHFAAGCPVAGLGHRSCAAISVPPRLA